jgi:MFS family permease
LTAEKLPPTVTGLAAVSGLNDAASEMVYPLLPAFIVGTLGGSAATLGALDGASDLAASLLRFLSGKYADQRTKRGPLVAFGYGIAVAVRPIIALAQSAGIVIGLRIVDRIGKGLRSPARDAMIADAVSPAIRGRAFGFQRAFDHGGAVVGGLLAWGLVQFGGLVPRQVIGWSVLPGVVALGLLMITLRRTKDARLPARGGPANTEHRSSIIDRPKGNGRPHVFWLPVLSLVLVLIARLPETLLLLHLQRGGVALALVPLAWAALHVVRAVTAYPAGRLVDAVGERGVIALSGTLSALTSVAYARAATPVLLVLAFLSIGLVSAVSEPAERTLVARLAPKGAGLAFGQAQALQGLGAIGAGLGFGAWVDSHGSASALLISAAATAVATALWLGVMPKRMMVDGR